MFDKLIDFLISILNDLLPFFIIKEYQQAVHLRGGVFLRVVEKGFHFKIPFYDEFITQHTVVTTHNLPPQSLVTKDNRNLVVRGMIKYKVTDVKTFILEVFDSKDALSDITQAIIKNIIMNSTYQQCMDPEIDNLITKKTRIESKKWGVETLQVTLTDIAEMRSFRILNDSQIVSNAI